MVTSKIIATALTLALSATLTAACTGSGDPAPTATTAVTGSALELNPQVGDGAVYAVEVSLEYEDNKFTAMVDTGSPYSLFKSDKIKAAKLDCDPVLSFHYGSGNTKFCPVERTLGILGKDGDVFPWTTAPLTVGAANNINIVGVTGNIDPATNRPGMTSTIEQTQPQALSFRWPRGLSESGDMRFAPLSNPGKQVAAIDLVDPGALSYGYTGTLVRLEYLQGDDVHTSLRQTDDGVNWVRGDRTTKVADSMLAFFDTGTTIPNVMVNGDISLMGDQVNIKESAALPGKNAPRYDGLRLVLSNAAGEEQTLTASQWPALAEQGATGIPQPADFPKDISQLVAVTGLNFIGRFDLQFNFTDGRAESLQFFER
jgi:hypothetical protein